MVWVAFSKHTLIGPYFFEKNVDGEAYQNLLIEFFFRPLGLEKYLFAKHGISRMGPQPTVQNMPSSYSLTNLVIESFHVVLTEFGHPAVLILILVTTTFGAELRRWFTQLH